MAKESKAPSVSEKFEALKLNAISYNQINKAKKTGQISDKDLRGHAAQMAPDDIFKAYLMREETPIEEIYEVLDKWDKRANRIADEVGINELEKIVDSTNKPKLKHGLGFIKPDSSKVGDNYKDSAQYHSDMISMQEVALVYQNKDAEDEDREKALKKMKNTAKSFYNSQIDGDKEPEMKEIINWLIEESVILGPNIYMNLLGKTQEDFSNSIKGQEKGYVKSVISNDGANRDRFYTAIATYDMSKKQEQEQGQQRAA